MGEFKKESELCAAFMSRVGDDWTVYPETGGFDIMLVRKADGFQIGIEAKLTLNAKVILQVAEQPGHYSVTSPGPDCRAVLVPERQKGGTLAGVCRLLGITVIGVPFDQVEAREWYGGTAARFRPALPKLGDCWSGDDWYEFHHESRIALPDYVPDTAAGMPCPVTLTDWKIRAIKLTILMERTGYLTRQDFKHLGVSIGRWIYGTSPSCVHGDVKGQYVKGKYFPDFTKEHPVNCQQIADDFDKWNPRTPGLKT